MSEAPLRVLLMANVPEDANAGAAGTEYQTVQALRRAGHYVETVWSTDLPRRVQHGNLHYLIELPRTYRAVMLERLRRAPFDVVHVNQPHGYLAARAHHQWRGPRGISSAFIHRSHGFEPRVDRDLDRWRQSAANDQRGSSRRLLSRLMSIALMRNYRGIARFADGHIVSATACGDMLSETFGVEPSAIAVIAQAAPPAYVATPAKTFTAERLRRVLYVGQFAFVKGPEIVAGAIAHAARNDATLRFTWVAGVDHHARIRALLPEDVRERVELKDWMPQEDLRSVYDDHGVLLFPSLFEGFGKAAMEAMARGLCVISSENCGVSEIIAREACGVVVPTGSVEATRDSLMAITRRIEEAADLAARAAEVARRYTWDGIGREIVSFYRSRVAASYNR
jgi:glycosyltransferase involved in cell wall biosynthesis